MNLHDEERWREALQHRSSAREKILEHKFLGALLGEFWQRAWFQFGVARGEVDDGGYDVVVELGAITRHIQLKSKYVDGKSARYSVNKALSDRPSGCVVVLVHELCSLDIASFYFFGGNPGQPLPELGEREVRHTKGDAMGFKAVRPAHREVPLGRFQRVGSVRDLVDRLFVAG
jgi:hypothetical protein